MKDNTIYLALYNMGFEILLLGCFLPLAKYKGFKKNKKKRKSIIQI